MTNREMYVCIGTLFPNESNTRRLTPLQTTPSHRPPALQDYQRSSAGGGRLAVIGLANRDKGTQMRGKVGGGAFAGKVLRFSSSLVDRRCSAEFVTRISHGGRKSRKSSWRNLTVRSVVQGNEFRLELQLQFYNN